MKAYKVNIVYDCFYSTIVFADTAGKARAAALRTDLAEDCDFTEIRVRRVPQLDFAYRGKEEMDWYDPEDHLNMVKYAGFSCEEVDLDECSTCNAKDYCNAYKDFMSDMEK